MQTDLFQKAKKTNLNTAENPKSKKTKKQTHFRKNRSVYIAKIPHSGGTPPNIGYWLVGAQYWVKNGPKRAWAK